MSARDAARRLAEAYRDSGALWTASLVADRVLPLGTMRFWKDVHVPLAELRAQVDAILAAWGMAADARTTTLEHLLYADLHGIDSHGSAMLRAYQREHTAGQWRADAALGTNPIAFAAPVSGAQPFLLDMATSTAPLGRLGLAAHRGQLIPRGWALDPRGGPETNARRAIEARRLTPLGGSLLHGSHKGYGLATMVEILSAVLPGTFRANPVAGDVPRVGHFFLCLDPRRFRGADAFASDLGGLADRLRALPPVDPDVPVQVAGDPEYAIAARRTREGIPFARSVVEDIRHVARAAGATFLLRA